MNDQTAEIILPLRVDTLSNVPLRRHPATHWLPHVPPPQTNTLTHAHHSLSRFCAQCYPPILPPCQKHDKPLRGSNKVSCAIHNGVASERPGDAVLLIMNRHTSRSPMPIQVVLCSPAAIIHSAFCSTPYSLASPTGLRCPIRLVMEPRVSFSIPVVPLISFDL